MSTMPLFRPKMALGCLLAATAAFVVLTGCGKKPDRPPVYPVSGELFVKGQPATGALVVLRPADDSEVANWTHGFPRARVDADGKFQFETFDPKDGAPVGTYKVLAQWQSGEDGEEENPNAPPRTDRIPASYFDATQTPWTAEVKPQANTLPRFDIP